MATIQASITPVSFTGLYAVLPTPFSENLEVDEASLRQLVEFYLAKQANGIVTLSVLGEVSYLSFAERAHVARIVIDQVQDRAPVIVGVTGELGAVAYCGQEMRAIGAAGLLVIPPVGLTLEDLREYYGQLAISSKLPLVILDYPPLTGQLPVDFLCNLVTEVENIQAIKLEEINTAVKIRQLRQLLGKRLQILGGLGGLYLLPELEAGSDGLMTGYAHPEQLIEIMHQFQHNHLEAAQKAYADSLSQIEFEQHHGLAQRKQALCDRGIIATAKLRRPSDANGS